MPACWQEAIAPGVSATTASHFLWPIRRNLSESDFAGLGGEGDESYSVQYFFKTLQTDTTEMGVGVQLSVLCVLGAQQYKA